VVEDLNHFSAGCYIAGSRALTMEGMKVLRAKCFLGLLAACAIFCAYTEEMVMLMLMLVCCSCRCL
jgi:hypothetical protein